MSSDGWRAGRTMSVLAPIRIVVFDGALCIFGLR